MYPDALAVIGDWGPRWHVAHCSNLDLMRSLPDCCVDSIVTDPPAGISFMGRKWDGDKGGRKQWIAWLTEIMVEALRVLKPGGHALLWALPRTSHWTGTALEDAGFEVRDMRAHLFGSGYPKSLNVAAAIDSELGAEPTITGHKSARLLSGHLDVGSPTIPTTIPTTPQAIQYQGWGTATKPAFEVWWLARKPLEGNVAQNVMKYGTGGINIDACRVATDWNEPDRPDSWKRSGHTADATVEKIAAPPGDGVVCHPGGRFPANVTVQHLPTCRLIGSHEESIDFNVAFGDEQQSPGSGWGTKKPTTTTTTTTVPDYRCSEGCPVLALDRQAPGNHGTNGGTVTPIMQGMGYAGGNGRTATIERDNIGSVSRFFNTFPPEDPFLYCAKPSRAEREAGCDALPPMCRTDLSGRDDEAPGQNNPRAGVRRQGEIRNGHPCVKAIGADSRGLMRWMCRLITPPNGIVFDLFGGSGSTVCGAVAEGFRALACDMDIDYVRIARARAEWWQSHPGGPTPEARVEAKLEARGQVCLFK